MNVVGVYLMSMHKYFSDNIMFSVVAESKKTSVKTAVAYCKKHPTYSNGMYDLKSIRYVRKLRDE